MYAAEKHRLLYTANPAQAGFGSGILGWPDAAQVSTCTLSYLIDKLPAIKLAEIESDDYYDFTKIRPLVNIEGGLVSSMTVPKNGAYYLGKS